MIPLAQLIREEFNKAEDHKGDYIGTKKVDFLLDAIEEAGLKIQAHQNGIQGTFMTISEK